MTNRYKIVVAGVWSPYQYRIRKEREQRFSGLQAASLLHTNINPLLVLLNWGQPIGITTSIIPKQTEYYSRLASACCSCK